MRSLGGRPRGSRVSGGCSLGGVGVLELAHELRGHGLGLAEEIAFRELDAVVDELADIGLVLDLLDDQLQVEIVERGAVLSPGDIFGEMALFTTKGRRTATARCVSDVSLLVITYEQFEQLYFQNPEFGLYLVRLIVRRFEMNHRDEELESA